MKLFQTPLPSGRGVKFRELGPFEHEKLMTDAAKIVGADASMIELKRKEWALGVRKFVHSVTTEDGHTPDTLLGAKWKKLNEQDLDQHYEHWFTTKDHQMLLDLFRQHHEVNMDDVKAIAGKVMEVTED